MLLCNQRNSATLQLIFPASLLINPYLSLYIQTYVQRQVHVLVVVLFFQSNEPLDCHTACGSFHNRIINIIIVYRLARDVRRTVRSFSKDLRAVFQSVGSLQGMLVSSSSSRPECPRQEKCTREEERTRKAC